MYVYELDRGLMGGASVLTGMGLSVCSSAVILI